MPFFVEEKNKETKAKLLSSWVSPVCPAGCDSVPDDCVWSILQPQHHLQDVAAATVHVQKHGTRLILANSSDKKLLYKL